jgi:hypothetical protein
VLVGPIERAVGDARPCTETMIELAQFGSVTVYLATR